jgi:spore coat polysaccharide biosynthesis predicted glycosyltransferase SpsG
MKASGLSFGCRCSELPNLLIIDSYNVDTKKLEVTSHHTTKILQIVDDINPKFYADAYLQASPINSWVPGNESAAILDFIASPILRKRFDSNDLVMSSKDCKNNKILISLGASNAIEQIIDSIIISVENSRFRDHQIFCLLSGNDLNSLRSFLLKNEIVAIEPGILVVDIAFDFDFVISACGVTAWEIVSSRIPCIVIGGAENQRNQLNYFVNLNIADGLMFEKQKDFIISLTEKLNGFSNPSITNEICNGRIRAVDWIENL